MDNDTEDEITEEYLKFTFNQLFEGYGGLKVWEEENVDFLLTEALYVMNYALGDVRENKPHFPKFYINFINSTSLNAVAQYYNGIGFIGVNYGTYLILFHLFSHMVSNDEIFPNFGNPQSGSQWAKLSMPEIINLEMFDDQLDPLHINPPLSKERDELARFLSGLAIMNVALHEYGHVANGHCGYLNSLVQSDFNISENEHFPATIGMSTLDRQTCEMDADSFSVFFGVQYLKNIMGLNRCPEFLRNGKGNYFDFLELWFFSTSTWWRIQNNIPFNVANLLQHVHPPVPLRLQMTINVLLTFFSENSDDFEAIGETMKSSVREVENAFKFVSVTGYTKQVYTREVLDELKKHEKNIMCNWNSLYSKLMPFAYANIMGKNDFCD